MWIWIIRSMYSPSAWVQNLILPPLAALAKVFGVRPYYDRWDTRLSARSAVAATVPLSSQTPTTQAASTSRS
jgi:hypothetical protein